MIKVRCQTNLDDYKLRDWPTAMCCRPVKGDAVEDRTGRYQLYVVSVTHKVAAGELVDAELAGQPYLVVELHKYYPRLDSCVSGLKALDRLS